MAVSKISCDIPTVIKNPWEVIDDTQCSLTGTDNWICVCGKEVSFSIRFTSLVDTVDVRSMLQIKSQYERFLPRVYAVDNGVVVPLQRTWDGVKQTLLFINSRWKIGVGSGLTANTNYIAQGSYSII